jgi:hypothetical protein
MSIGFWVAGPLSLSRPYGSHRPASLNRLRALPDLWT